MGAGQDESLQYRQFDEQTEFKFNDLLQFVDKCDSSFVPPLKSRGIDLNEYVAKLIDKAKILVALQDDVIVGVIAFYCYDLESGNAFITWLGVDENVRSKGVGKKLVGDALEYARHIGFKTCSAQASNEAAVNIYCKRYGGKIVGSKMEGSVKKKLIKMVL